jgi:prepilin-type N-terminal cleavage/methylation domain-containing protein
MKKSSIHGLLRAKMLHKARGFSLLEILVAFVLLALAMSILMQIFSTSINGANVADHYAKATMLAESRLAAVGVEEALKEGATNGRFDDRFAWQTEVKVYADPNADGATRSFEELLFVRLFEVTTTVSFTGDDNRSRNVTLTKLQVGARQTP